MKCCILVVMIIYQAVGIKVYVPDQIIMKSKRLEGNSSNWVPASTMFKGVKIPSKIPENIVIPKVPCPSVFQYRYAYEFGGFFGIVTVQKPYAEKHFKLDLNMTLDRPVNQVDNIKLILLSTQEEVQNSDLLKWAVTFPYQDLLPILTLVKFNERALCRNDPGLIMPGSYRSNLWVRNTLSVNSFNKGKNTRGAKDTKITRVIKSKKNKYSNVMNAYPPLMLPGYGIPPVEQPLHNQQEIKAVKDPSYYNDNDYGEYNSFYSDYSDYKDDQNFVLNGQTLNGFSMTFNPAGGGFNLEMFRGGNPGFDNDIKEV